MKGHVKDGEKYFQIILCDRELVSRICFKKLSELNNNSIRRWAKTLEQTLYQWGCIDGPWKGLTLSVIRNCLINATTKYYYTPIRMTKIKSTGNTKLQQRFRATDLSFIGGVNVKWNSHPENSLAVFLTSLYIYLPYDSVIDPRVFILVQLKVMSTQKPVHKCS